MRLVDRPARSLSARAGLPPVPPRRERRRVRWTTLAASAALLVAGCGGGGDQAKERVAREAERMRVKAAAPSQGRWAAPVALDFVPAAAAQVANGSAPGAGRVVMWSAENRFSFSAQGETDPNIRTWTAVFDAATGTAGASVANVTGHNMFCPGTANLADGRILVTGGSTSRVSSVYDPVSGTWSRPGGTVMNIPRAYHATVPLRDGSVFMLGGSWNGGSGGKDGEVWRPATGWQRLSGVPAAPFETASGRNDRDFHMWLLPAGNGRVFHAGPSRRMNWIDTRGSGSWTSAGIRGDDPDALQGSIAMFEPGRILVTGGARIHDGGPTPEGTATANAHLIDITGTPTTTRLPNMAFTRVFHNSVVLPNGQVMVIGGRDVSSPFNDTNARMVPELFDPATRTFVPLPALSIPRTYHSWALLLPDARVMVAGGGLCNCAADQPTYQLYSPHYLFNPDGSPAARPQMTAAPTQADYGSEMAVTTDVAVSSFVLVRTSSVTHTVNNDQRRIPLQVVSASGTSYRVAAPSNPGWAMPGDYMLFAIDARGVPSLARTVRLGLGSVPLVEPVSDQTATAGIAIAPLTVNAPVVSGRTFTATGLPPGLAIEAGTGIVRGTPTASGVFRVSVGVRAGTGGTATEFLWIVNGAGTDPAAARYLRLEQLTEINGNPWGSMAELDLLNPQGAVLPRTGWRVSASSVETVASDGAAANAIDGNRATIWHTQWSAANPPPPHRFDVDLGSSQVIGGLRYLPRTDGTPNGTIAQYRVFLSQDGVNWGTPVTSGDLRTVTRAADGTQTVMFAPAQTPNRPPTLATPAPQTVAAGSTVSLALTASDPDGDRLTFGATGLPAGLSIDTAAGTIRGTPTTAGTSTATVTVSDGRGGSASATFGWTVTTAQAPVVQPVSAPPATAGTAVTFTASATGAGLTYSWNFGDGSPPTAFSTSPTATRTYAAPGLYTVTLTVRAADGVTTSTRTFTQAVSAAPTTVQARASSAMALQTRSGASPRLWVVNPDHDTVTVVDTATNSRVAVLAVGAAPQSVAVAPNGAVWVSNRDASSISVIAAGTLAVSTIALPRASQPHGLVIAPDGTAFVALAARGEVQRINADRTLGARVAVGADVRELAISGDATRLLATRFVTPPLPGEGTATVDTAATRGAEVVVLNPATLARTATVILRHSDRPDSTVQGRGIPNYLGAPVIAPDGRSAWVPAKQDNIRRGTLRDGQPLDFQNTVRAISSRIDLVPTTPVEDHASRLDHDNASLASAAAFHPSGAYLFVALETSRQVAVVDPAGRRELFRVQVGRAPQGLALSPDGLRLYVSNFMDRSVSVLDLTRLVNFGEPSVASLATVAAAGTERLSPQVLAGKQLFYDAADRRLSRDAYMSCASCHRDGSTDGRVWDLTGLGEGLRNTPSLRGRAGMGHGAVHWSGNFDEVQDFEGQIRTLAGGTGLMTDAQFATGTRAQPLGDRKAGVSADLDALAAYVASLNTVAPTPQRNADGTLTAGALAGRTLFQNLSCASCHGGVPFTGSTLTATLRDVGTLKPSSGQRLGAALTGIDPPTLRDVWATAPYLHDGSAATVEAAIRAHTGAGMPNAAAVAALSATDLGNLASYVRQIGAEEVAPPVTTPTGSGTGLAASYFANATLAGTPVLTRTDTPWFDWGGGSPGAGVPADNFSVRWRGEVQAVEAGTYQFRTTSDDGIRVWINGALVIDNWTAHAPTIDVSPVIALAAGQRVPIVVEFQEFGGGAVLQLGWLRPGGAWAMVPTSQLYPAAATANRAPTVSLTAPAANGSATLGASITVSAVAADADGTVASVQFFDGTTPIGTDTTAPYGLTWTPTTAGARTLTARATDNLGAVTTSAAVAFTVASGTTPPGQPPADAVACASENGTCTLPAGVTATVWYGANTSWAVRSGVTGSIACTNAVFGDPLYGVVKACRYQVAVGSTLPPATPTSPTSPTTPTTPTTVQTSPVFGSTTAGTPFTDPVASGQMLTGVVVRAGWWVDAVQGLATPANLPMRGGTGGGANTVTLASGEHIVRIFGRADGNVVAQIGFTTSAGRTVGPFAIANGVGPLTAFDYTVPAGHRVLGFTGRSGTALNAIGVVFGR